MSDEQSLTIVNKLYNNFYVIPTPFEGEFTFKCCGKKFEWTQDYYFEGYNHYNSKVKPTCPDCYNVEVHEKDQLLSKDFQIFLKNKWGAYHVIAVFKNRELIIESAYKRFEEEIKQLADNKELWKGLTDINWSLIDEWHAKKNINQVLNMESTLDNESISFLEKDGKLSEFLQVYNLRSVNMILDMKNVISEIVNRMNSAGHCLSFGY